MLVRLAIKKRKDLFDCVWLTKCRRKRSDSFRAIGNTRSGAEPLNYIPDDPEELCRRFTFIDVNVHVIKMPGHSARNKNDRNVRLHPFHFPRQFSACTPMEHMVGYRGAYRCLSQGLQSLVCRCHSDNVVAALLQNLLS